MSFHPNDVARRARAAGWISVGLVAFLIAAFFRTQILRNTQYVLQSEENRLREVPIAAPRGMIYDRKGKIIAENVVGYTVSVLAQSEDSLRGTLRRLSGTIQLSQTQQDQAVRRYRRAPTRPTVILNDASFDVVSVLEEHRVDFPSLIIMSAPKRFYPDGPAVLPFVGYVNEISESELSLPQYATYKAGQIIGKQGLEKEYEAVLHGREGSRFVEVDARGRVVREQGAQEKRPVQAGSLQTNIDLDLQLFTAQLFADSLVGGAVAMDPNNGEVLALYSNPSYDPNKFIGGVSFAYYDSLRTNPKQPLYNKALQGTYPPGSTWKLATAVLGIQEGLVKPETHMPQACNGFYYFGNRAWHCWEKSGHGSLDLTGAIAKSCDVYFYQLGLKLGLSRLVAGGVQLGFANKAGIDLPEERKPSYPDRMEYFDEKYGARSWSGGAMVMNLSIGQGENSQSVLNMARFYTALATDGSAAKPEIVHRRAERTRIMNLTPDQLEALRQAMAGVTQAGGTAASAALGGGVTLAGKTGTAQKYGNASGRVCDHAWFVGFAPVEKPKIVVAVMLECGGHGYLAARVASAIIGKYLGVPTMLNIQTEG
ncbi:MAG TPA: penicillin-binding protein 2 [Gemmatimonadaceae bacterium]|nr:penicillin-binding protein 2 [Gemmatimonadaceae bacterium]